MQYSYIRWNQRLNHATNSFQPRSVQESRALPWGGMLIGDLRYAETYPNSYLDLYLHKDAKSIPHPTLFYVHGGGYTWGDKKDIYPFRGRKDHGWYVKAFMNAGYNIVSMDYALAPDYPYPTPIIQMCGAMAFVQHHAGDHGLDMRRVVLGGGSAGGNLIGQFANIQTNPSYAKEMGMEPVLQPGHLKAMVFNSALLDNERFGHTGVGWVDWMFRRCGQAYFHCEKLEGDADVIQSCVIRHASCAFPPSFISDANWASFTDQALDFDERLSELGVRHVLNIYPRSEARLFHGFESLASKHGKDNMEKTLDFLKEVVV